MNKFTIVTILFFATFNGFGQKIQVNANIGYGTFFLKDLKDFQSEMISSTSLNDEPVEDFPNYLYYNISVDYTFNRRHMVGLGATYYSSGGRNHIADYSGEYSLDMIASAYAFAVQYKVTIISFDKLDIFFQYKTGFLFSNVDISEKLEISNLNSNTTDCEYKGNSLVFEPGVYISYTIYKSIALNFSLGYERCSNSRLLNNRWLESDNDEVFFNYMENITADWTGLRTSIGITYSIGSRNKKKSQTQL